MIQSVTVRIDPGSSSQLEKLMKEMDRKCGRAVEDSIMELGRSCAKQLAHRVPPFGLSSAIGTRFEKSIAKQVDRSIRAANVGVVPGSSAAQAHAAARDQRGQVPKNLRTKGKRAAHQIPVRDKEAEVDRMQKAAGTAKGAWIAAGRSIGTVGGSISGVSRWITRHTQQGMSRVLRRGIRTEITLINGLPYIQRLQTPAMVQTALRNGFRNAIRFMERRISKVK